MVVGAVLVELVLMDVAPDEDRETRLLLWGTLEASSLLSSRSMKLVGLEGG